MAITHTQKAALIAGSIGAVVVGAGALLWTVLGGSDHQPDAPATDDRPRLAGDWSTDRADPISVSVDPRRGPLWQQDQPLPLLPRPPRGEPITWTHRSTADGAAIEGTTTWRGVPMSLSWEVQQGDPQARISLRVDQVPLSTLREHELTGRIVLPEGAVQLLDAKLRPQTWEGSQPTALSGWHPTWVRWQNDSSALTISDWTGDGLELHRRDDGTIAVDFHVWTPAAHPTIADCKRGDSDDPPLVTLSASATVTIGEAPPVFASRFPGGSQAALVPIFDTQSSATDTTLQRGSPEGPVDWAARARTLIFGHSHPDDPRYGNGGLLGHGLGGTVVVDASMAADEPVAQLRQEVGHHDLGVAVRGAPPEQSPPFATRIQTKPPCRQLLETAGAKTVNPPSALIETFVPLRGGASNLLASPKDDGGFVGPPGPPASTSVRPERLDGRRPSLLDRAFAPEVLERLVDQHGLAVVDTPLLGSRNPLIPAAKEALLHPERQGEWTLSAPFTSALTDLELLGEAHPLEVSSLSGIIDFWRDARRTERRWTPEGDLLVATPGTKPLPGYTLVVDGARLSRETIAIDGAPGFQLRTTPASTPPRTWIFWRLEPDQIYRLSFDSLPDGFQKLTPADWKIDGGT